MAIFLPLKCLSDVGAGDRALLVVAAADAEDVPHAALGDLRIGRGRRDLEDAVLLVDLGGRHGDAGIEVADDELDAVAGELVGDRDALLGIGDVVADCERDLLAEDAAGGVDVGDGLLGAVLELRAEGGVRAGDRAGDAEFDLGRGGAGAAQAPKPSARPSVVISSSSRIVSLSACADRSARSAATINAPNATLKAPFCGASAAGRARSLIQRYCVDHLARRGSAGSRASPNARQTAVSTR